MHDSWSAFNELTAPVPAQSGFLVAAAVAVFFAVFLADWAAFRLWSPVESIIPALTLFVFCTLLGSDQQRMTSAFLFCAASLWFLLAHRVARLETSSGWLTADIERGSRWLFRAGAALAAVAVIGGVIVGPRLPTANDGALVDYREGDNGGPSSRVTVSPLVDIRGRLVEQSDVPVFTVTSTQKAYWRLTSLDEFDGEIWRSGGSYGRASGDLEANTPDAVTSERLEQHYEIDRLGALWLPAAFQPVRVDTPGADPRYERNSSTLIVDTKYQSSDQLVYDVVSEVPAPTAEELELAEQTASEDMAPYMELPQGFSARAPQHRRRSRHHGASRRSLQPGARVAGLLPGPRRLRERRDRVGVLVGPGDDRSRQRRDRSVPREQRGLLRDVRRHVRGDGALDRVTGARCGRFHLG